MMKMCGAGARGMHGSDNVVGLISLHQTLLFDLRLTRTRLSVLHRLHVGHKEIAQ